MLNKQGPGKIDWCDVTWSPITGCLHNCSYCYMQRLVKRFGYDMTPRLHPDRLADVSPLKKPSKIFTCNTGDMFGRWVPPNWIYYVLNIIKENPEHTFQLLTKNPKRYSEFAFPENCWLGTTIDTQKRADTNLRYMNNLENIKYISFEPLLERVSVDLAGFDWIIIGANSNKGEPKPPNIWAYELIEQARKLDIPVWMKDNYKYPKKIKEWPK